MKPEQIAAGLSTAQRGALLAVSPTHYRPLRPIDSKALGAHWRWKLLMRDGKDYTLSDLGAQVRAALLATQEARTDGR